MKKIFILLIFLLAVQVKSFATTYYLSPSGGNQSSASTWASTSGGSDSIGVPDSTVDVVCDPNSGSAIVTCDQATNLCQSLNCTGFTGTAGTFNYNTSTIIVNQSATGAMSFTPGTAQFYNLTLNGHASTGCYKSFTGDLTVNNTLTISGNSSTNKLALKSSDTTVRTITAPSVTLSNIDYFQNIKGSGDGWIGKVPFFNSSNSWNTSSKYSGVLR